MIVTGQDGTRWFILKDMGYGFFIEDGDVFAVQLQENGLPHDDPVVFLVDDFDWPQDEIDKLKRMMLSVLTADLSAEEIETLNALQGKKLQMKIIEIDDISVSQRQQRVVDVP